MAYAELPTSKITEVKDYLKAEGYVTGSWKEILDDEYFCCTGYKSINSVEAVSNNIAYYVNGNRTTAAELKLVLNVNIKSKAQEAHSEFLKIAQALNVKATGKKLEDALAEAITKGTASEIKSKSYTTKIIRNDWPSGKGYDLQFIIE